MWGPLPASSGTVSISDESCGSESGSRLERAPLCGSCKGRGGNPEGIPPKLAWLVVALGRGAILRLDVPGRDWATGKDVSFSGEDDADVG